VRRWEENIEKKIQQNKSSYIHFIRTTHSSIVPMPSNKSDVRFLFLQPFTRLFEIRFAVNIIIATTVQDVPHVPDRKPSKEILQRRDVMVGMSIVWIDREINVTPIVARFIQRHLYG